MSKSPEPIILAVALLLLALGTASMAYLFPTLDQITGVTVTDAAGAGAQAVKAADIQASLAPWNSPATWPEAADHHRLFDSDQYLFYPSAYPNGDYVKKMDDKTRSPSGVLLSWYIKNNLDFQDAIIDREDPDNDGFSNLAEYKNEPVGVRLNAADLDGSKSTNPHDGASHPAYLSRLRLQKFDLRPFHIQFTGYQQLNGAYLFQLHLNDVPSYNQPALKKSGDELGFEGYVIGAFHQEFKDIVDPRTKAVVHTDVSTLVLEKPEIGLKVPLIFRQTVDSPESTANFVLLLPTETDKVIKVARGKVFRLPSWTHDENSYIVIEANDNGARIRDTKTQQEYTIPKLDPNEWNDVPQPVQTSQPIR